MAADFDNFPFYDKLLKEGSTRMSDIWVASLSNFIQTMTEYLTKYGIILPNITNDDRNTIQSPQNGQVIYNMTLDAPQFYQASSKSWRTITFT